ncbi:MAG: hypothetical protein CMN10_07730 [Roseobacter sp.]|nr:hypothetical protein [Roseobacter sp.]
MHPICVELVRVTLAALTAGGNDALHLDDPTELVKPVCAPVWFAYEMGQLAGYGTRDRDTDRCSLETTG